MTGGLTAMAAWGPGIEYAEGLTGDQELRETATLGAVESATLGLMGTSQANGLRSGGLVGYKGLFTGYDPERHGALRKMGLGRAIGSSIGLGAKALMQTGLRNTAARRYLEPLTMTGDIGLSGVFTARTSGEMMRAQRDFAQQTFDELMGHGLADQFNKRAASGGTPLADLSPRRTDGSYIVGKAEAINRATRNGATRADYVENTASLYKKGGYGKRVVGVEARAAGRRASESASAMYEKDSFGRRAFKWLTGGAGGSGFDEAGEFAGEVATVTSRYGNEYSYLRAAAGSSGAVWKGGGMLGSVLKYGGYMELGIMAGEVAGAAVGSGYEALVSELSEMESRLQGPSRMSGAYNSRMHATERTRAIREIQQANLTGDALLGSEARMVHR